MPELTTQHSVEFRKFRKLQLDAKRRKVNSITGTQKQSNFTTPTYPTTSGTTCYVSINFQNF